LTGERRRRYNRATEVKRRRQDVSVYLPLLSSLVSLIFALAVFDQYLSRRRPYQLIWTLGLLAYFISTGAEFITGAFGLNANVYRLWYLFGAIYTAAWLGMGTIYLLTPRNFAHGTLIVLSLASIFAIYRVFTSPVDLSPLVGAATLSGEAFAAGAEGPRILTPFFNTFGTVALVGGAIWSAWVFWRRRIMPHRVTSNVLIALGALLPAGGGTLARFGAPEFLYVSELLGVSLIFLGFLRSSEVFGFYRFPPLIHRLRRA